MKFNVIAFVIAISLTACSAPTPFDPSTQPVSALSPVTTLGERLVAEQKFSGALFAVLKEGQVVHYSEHGTYGVDNPKPLARETIFRIYSMTKPVTAVAAMMLYEQGLFDLDDPVAKYLPEFAQMRVLDDEGVERVASNAITIRQLLTHSAGFTYGFAPDSPADSLYFEAQLFNAPTLDDFIDQLVTLPLRFEPGTRYRYSVSIDVVGALVERLSGQNLDSFFKQRIFEPLEMDTTFFELPDELVERFASDQYWNAEAEKIDIVPAGMSRNFVDNKLYMGGGGLVSTIDDYLRFCQMILNGGELNGQRLLEAETVDLMLTDHLAPEVRSAGGPYPDINLYDGQSMGLGFAIIHDETQLPPEYVANEVSWGGMAGTQFWIDPTHQTAGVAMVQLVGQPWAFDALFRVAAQQGLDTMD